MFESLKTSKEALDNARAAAKAAFKSHAKAAFGEVFAAHPEITAIRWAQYAPSFNDGDPCVFSVHEWYAKIGDTKEGGDNDDGFLLSYESEKVEEAEDDIDALFALFDDDVMEDEFGSSVKVTATRDGFETEEYNDDY